MALLTGGRCPTRWAERALGLQIPRDGQPWACYVRYAPSPNDEGGPCDLVLIAQVPQGGGEWVIWALHPANVTYEARDLGRRAQWLNGDPPGNLHA